jgi:hypothetical protein
MLWEWLAQPGMQLAGTEGGCWVLFGGVIILTIGVCLASDYVRMRTPPTKNQNANAKRKTGRRQTHEQIAAAAEPTSNKRTSRRLTRNKMVNVYSQLER